MHYQNLVYKKEEEKIKKKAYTEGYRVKIDQHTPIEISSVLISNGDYKIKNSFQSDEPISITVEYSAKEAIENPIFNLDIARADGVICCSLNTKDNDVSMNRLKGNGRIKIDLGRINLAPGIYVARISIWDKDMIHAYTRRNKDIFKIELNKFNRQIKAVFLPKVKWELQK